MAITVNNTPGAFQSFHEDMWYVVTSDNIAQTSFKYVFDVYINSVLVARIKSFPQPTTDKGLFNVAPIIRNYWESYFQPATSQTAFNHTGSGNMVSFTIQFGEDYAGTIYTNLTSSAGTGYNYYPNISEGKGAFDGTWFENGYAGVNLLTKRDLTQLQTNQSGNRLFISMNNFTSGVVYDWKLNVTRSNGNDTTGGTFVDVSGIAVIDISPVAINNYLGGTFISSATDSYVVGFEELGVGTQAEVTVTKICQPRHTHIPLHFLNSLGGYDTMIFTLVNRESRNIERKSFEQIDWQYRSNDMFRYNQYNVFNGGAVQFNTQHTITYKLTSDWLTLTDYTWLRDLIASPEVYMENSGTFIPIKITTSQWTQKKQYVDKVYNLELDIEFGSKEFSQYR
jgi:hypothetical protein